MCTDTKGRIAEAVEQMLQTRPVCKITVQRVMEQAQMKRQSFYYHYQDIYSVLEWIVETQLCAPLQYDGAQAPGEWCLQALTLLREKQPLLRKISHALGQETMYRLTGKVIRPQLAQLHVALKDQDALAACVICRDSRRQTGGAAADDDNVIFHLSCTSSSLSLFVPTISRDAPPHLVISL